MNNLLSYCGLVDAKIRASDKDLPVHKFAFSQILLDMRMGNGWANLNQYL